MFRKDNVCSSRSSCRMLCVIFLDTSEEFNVKFEFFSSLLNAFMKACSLYEGDQILWL
tara:strand:- start:7938 stop:8111 length:174 start_codon:yes stop_codon:yes gene_type:complete